MAISKEDLDNWFTYHSPKPGQNERYLKIREAARALADVIVENSPASADQTAAIRKVREATMTANQSIACEDESESIRFASISKDPKVSKDAMRINFALSVLREKAAEAMDRRATREVVDSYEEAADAIRRLVDKANDLEGRIGNALA